MLKLYNHVLTLMMQNRVMANPFLFCTCAHQILMTELDPKFMALFSTLAYSSSEVLTRDVGLLDLIPDCIVDSKIFEPCGYSLNAIVKVCTCTFHVYCFPECKVSLT